VTEVVFLTIATVETLLGLVVFALLVAERL
jgi:hypothetical protein